MTSHTALPACDLSLRRQYMNLLPALHFENTLQFVRDAAASTVVLVLAVSPSIMSHSKISVDDQNIIAFERARQDVLATYCEAFSLELHTPIGVWLLEKRAHVHQSGVNKPEVRKPENKETCAEFFHQRFRLIKKGIDTKMKNNLPVQETWFIPCPFPPYFTSFQAHIALAVGRTEGFEGGRLNEQRTMMIGLRLVRDISGRGSNNAGAPTPAISTEANHEDGASPSPPPYRCVELVDSPSFSSNGRRSTTTKRAREDEEQRPVANAVVVVDTIIKPPTTVGTHLHEISAPPPYVSTVTVSPPPPPPYETLVQPIEPSSHTTTCDSDDKNKKQTASATVGTPKAVITLTTAARPTTLVALKTPHAAAAPYAPPAPSFRDTPMWIATPFLDSWFWRRCSLVKTSATSAAAAASAASGNGINTRSSTLHSTNQKKQQSALRDSQHNHSHENSPPYLLPVCCEQRGKQVTVITKRDFGHLSLSTHATPFAVEAKRVLPVSPSQSLYAEVAAARGGGGLEVLDVSHAKDRRGTTGVPTSSGGPKRTTEQRGGGMLPLTPGWSLTFLAAAGCFALIDHTAKRAFLDSTTVPKSRGLWKEYHEFLGGLSGHSRDVLLILRDQQTSEVLSLLPPLLRKSMQYMTTAEANHLLDNFALTNRSVSREAALDEAAIHDNSMAVIFETTPAKCSSTTNEGVSFTPLSESANLYSAVQTSLERRDTVPMAFYNSFVAHKDRNSGKKRAEKQEDCVTVTLPPGCYEDDHWVVNHVLGVAAHEAVPFSCRLPQIHSSDAAAASLHTTSGGGAGELNRSSRRRSFATVVPEDGIHQWSWQQTIKAELHAARDASLAMSMCTDEQLSRRMSTAASDATTMAQLSRLGERTTTKAAPFNKKEDVTSLIHILRRMYQHHEPLLDADGSMHLSLLLGESRKDALYYQRWRHLSGASAQLRVAGLWLDQTMAALIVQSLVVVTTTTLDVVDGGGGGEEELPPYAFIPIAFNGTVDCFEELCHDAALVAIGELLSQWFVLTTPVTDGDDVSSSASPTQQSAASSSLLWTTELMPLCAELGICDASIVRWKAPVTLDGRIRISSI